MSRVTPRILGGFVELLPEDQIQLNAMFDTIRSVYESYGYAPIETPAIELGEVLLAKAGGETEKQIYKIARDGDDKEMALHFDLTVPLARYVAQHEGELVFPFRRYQMQKVWRGERAQAGRYREFYQCDVDVVGGKSTLYDAEMPAIISSVFRRLGVGSFTIRINNRKVLQGFLEHLGAHHISAEVLRVIDKIDKIGAEKVEAELLKLGVEKEATTKLLEFIAIDGLVDEVIARLEQVPTQNTHFVQGVAELKGLVAGVRELGVPTEDYMIDLRIARGLDYYTGTVYETVLDDFQGLGSVCSGGRYDDLASYYTKSKLPGVGISIGLTRLFGQLKDVGLVKSGARTPSQGVILPLSEATLAQGLQTATKLREQGIAVEVYMEQTPPSKQMRYADRLGVPYAVIIGEEERAKGTLLLKDMRSGEQRHVTHEELTKLLAK